MLIAAGYSKRGSLASLAAQKMLQLIEKEDKIQSFYSYHKVKQTRNGQFSRFLIISIPFLVALLVIQ